MKLMPQRLPWIALLLLLPTLLTGCGQEPPTPEASAAAARAFMQARVNGNAARVYEMLTTRAQKSVTRSRVSGYLSAAETTFADLGSPQEVEPGVVRIAVKNLALIGRERTVRWPEAWLTLRYESNHWRVAWAEPLFAEAAQAYQNAQFLDELKLGHEIVAIDPYHYRGYLELHFAYRELARMREAEAALNTALARTTPAQQPDAHDAMARFKLELGDPNGALAHARRALELAGPYVPGTYSVRWQADTLVVAGRAALAANDRATAEAMAGQAAADRKSVV